jgi:RND family efflux transporter MFP subunit
MKSVLGMLRVGASALFAAMLLSACAKPEPAPLPVRPVQLSQVKQGGTTDTAVFAGEVKPRHESDLGFRIAGKVIARSVDVGARVTRGQTLARLDPADVGLQADAQIAVVAAAETEYRYAQAEFERYQNLFRQKFVSESALDQKKNTRDSNRAKWEQARAQLSVTQNQANYATLVAPDNGVITAVGVESGQVVAAGQTVMKLAREDEHEVAISVPESRIGEVRAAKTLVVVGESTKALSGARARNRAGGRSGDADVCRARVGAGAGSRAAMGDDGQRRADER